MQATTITTTTHTCTAEIIATIDTLSDLLSGCAYTVEQLRKWKHAIQTDPHAADEWPRTMVHLIRLAQTGKRS
jgi:hypothetical protein